MSSSYAPSPILPGEDLRSGMSAGALFGVLRRRRAHFLLPALAIAGAFAAAAYLLPARYRAGAVVEAVAGGDAQNGGAPLDPQSQVTRIQEILGQRSVLDQASKAYDNAVAATSAATASTAAVQPASEASVQAVRSGLRVLANGPTTFAIGFEDRDPQRAARVSAALGHLLVKSSEEQLATRTRDAVASVEEQMRGLEAHIAEQETAMQQYKERVFSELPEQVPNMVEMLKGVQQRLQETDATVADLEARSAALRQEMADLERQGSGKSPVETRRDQLRANVARLKRQYTDEHPEVIQARAELAQFESAIADGSATQLVPDDPASPARARYAQAAVEATGVEQRLASARARRSALVGEMGSYQGRMAAAPRHESALAGMNREYEMSKSQQQALTEDLRQARLQGAREGSFRLVEEPLVPSQPVAPQRTRIILMGILAGLGVGFAVAFLANQGDTSFRSMEDFAAPSSLPVLAEIPAIGSRLARRLLPERAGAASPMIAPHTAAAEQFRILAAKLARRSGPQRPLALLVTSANPGEGKTVAAVNIALALSQMVEQPVLLVDADLGRPTVQRLLRLPPGPGLAELLLRPDDDPARFLRTHDRLQVLQAGRFSLESRTALASAAGERLFARLRQRYAYVVVDGPPILAVAEGVILQRVVDSIALVVRAGATPRHMVQRALQNLDPTRVVGVVLNDVDSSPAVYSYPYYDVPTSAAGGSSQPW